jgi:dihydroorotase
MRRLTITRPDDWHIHLRDDDYLPDTVRDAARYFGRAIVMPNLQPPVDSTPRVLPNIATEFWRTDQRAVNSTPS